MMNIRILLFVIALSVGLTSKGFSQYFNSFEENFENSPTVYFEDGSNINHFVVGECAGNSSPSAGSLFSLYVATKTGNDFGCTLGSDNFYNYLPSPSGTDTILAYFDIPSSNCVQGDMILNFDYKMATGDASDHGVIIYRLNATDPWSVLTNITTSTNTWLQANYALPNTLNHQNFQLGFYFVFDESTTNGIPLAIDNIVVKGLDIIDPIITCPGTQNLYGDATCSAILPSFTNLAVATDNCSPVGNLIFSQSPDMGETATGTTEITITVTDISGNSSACTFDIEMIDTIQPIINCNESHPITDNDNGCSYDMPDLSNNVVTISDNCSTNNFTITQSIAVGTHVNGIKIVTIYVEDEQGNQASCPVRTTPIDTIPPVVTCPSDKVIDNGTDCAYIVADFTSEVIATDNCTITSIVQVPVSGEIIYTGTHEFSFRVTDELGNFTDCTTEVKIIENIIPQITSCPSDINTCNPEVSFPPIQATDNCGFDIFKTDLSGLNSGDMFPIGTTQMQYTARDSSGNEAVCNFEITILPSPDEPTFATNPIELCSETATTISANPVSTGTGFWSLPSGSALQLEDENQATTTVSNLAEGENIIYWNTTSAGCGSNQAALKINNAPIPSAAIVTKDTTYKCNENNLLISAIPPTKGFGLWTAADSVNLIANANNHNAIVTKLQEGWSMFYYTVSSGVCMPNVDSMAVFKIANPEISSFADTSICEKVALELNGSTPPAGVEALWFFNKGRGEFSQEDSATTLVTEYQRGINEIVYAYNNPHCGWTYDTITITYNACDGDEFIIPTLITPNQDGKNDAFVIEGLHDAYPTCKVTIVNRWGGVVYKSEGYELPWDGTHKGKPVPSGTYYYVIELNDGGKKSINGPISVLR